MTTDLRPLVTIVTPVFNCRQYIEACLKSVLAQDYDCIEHLVIDGASTDGTLQVLEAYAKEHPGRVRVVSGPDTGAGDAWNKGMKMAGGEILGCIGADDECEAGAVKAVVDYFRSHAEADFLHGGCRILHANGSTTILTPAPFDYQRFVNTAIDVATPSAYYRRKVLERVGWLDECSDDFDLMLRITKQFQVHRLTNVLSTLRLYQGSTFNPPDVRDRARVFRETFVISRRHGGALTSRLAFRYYFFLVVAALHLGAGYRLLRAWRARGGGDSESCKSV